MSGNKPKKAPQFDHNSAVHQPFSWLDDAAKTYPMADFVELTMDVSRGVHACLEIIEASNLECSWNAELDPEDATLPTLNRNDTGKLMRLAIATIRLLREHADHNLDWLNAHGAKHLQAMKKCAKCAAEE